MKGKKAMMPIIMIVILIIMTFSVIALENKSTNVFEVMGQKQQDILRSYDEQNKLRDYLELSAKYATYLAIEKHGCPVTITPAFEETVQDAFNEYSDAYPKEINGMRVFIPDIVGQYDLKVDKTGVDTLKVSSESFTMMRFSKSYPDGAEFSSSATPMFNQEVKCSDADTLPSLAFGGIF